MLSMHLVVCYDYEIGPNKIIKIKEILVCCCGTITRLGCAV